MHRHIRVHATDYDVVVTEWTLVRSTTTHRVKGQRIIKDPLSWYD